MKLVTWEDEQGRLRRSALLDEMSSNRAHQGVPMDVPDLSLLDCEQLLLKLHNLLAERNLFDLKDLQHNNLLSSSILSVFKPAIVTLYKEKANADKKLLT